PRNAAGCAPLVKPRVTQPEGKARNGRLFRQSMTRSNAREKHNANCRQQVRESKSRAVALQEPRLTLRKTRKRSLVPNDAGGEGSADALYLDAEGPDAGGCRRQFRPAESPDGLQERTRAWPGGAPQRCGKGQRRARHGGTHQRDSEIFHREQPPGNSRDVSRRVFARPRRSR